MIFHQVPKVRQIKVMVLVFALLGLAGELQANWPTPPQPASGYSLAFFDDFTNLDISPNGSGQHTWYPGIWWERHVGFF